MKGDWTLSCVQAQWGCVIHRAGVYGSLSHLKMALAQVTLVRNEM